MQPLYVRVAEVVREVVASGLWGATAYQVANQLCSHTNELASPTEHAAAAAALRMAEAAGLVRRRRPEEGVTFGRLVRHRRSERIDLTGWVPADTPVRV